MIYSLGDMKLKTETDDFYIVESADIIGAVHLGDKVSIWWNTVIRADNEPITIGDRTNIQDGCVLHTDPGFPINIAANVSVGHKCMLHGCSVGYGSLIGIGSIILNGAKIEPNCIIGAGSLIVQEQVIPEGSLVYGRPGKIIRVLSKIEITSNKRAAAVYIEKIKVYRNSLYQISLN